MGAIVQECLPVCLQKLSIKERKRTSYCHNIPSNTMGRRQPQRRSPLPHNTSSWQDNNHFTEKRTQQRRKNRTNIPSTKCTSQTSAQGTQADPVCRVAPSVGERREVQRPHSRYREHSTARSQHGATLHPTCRLTDSGPDPPEGQGPRQDPGKCYDPGEDTDSDRDLSDTERLPASPTSLASSAVPPKLNLRPEVFGPCDLPPDPRRPRERGAARTSSTYPYPDSLPPPFNTWSLAQLACFYHTESQRSPRPRPTDPLQRFLERLLQLEWRCTQTVQQEEEEGGAGGHASVVAPARHAVRLSCPKSILQCQRAFPLTFLSSPAVDSALLSGCGCSQCRQRYAQAASAMSSFSASLLGGGGRRCRCPSAHARPRPLAEHVPVPPLPKRSVSETRTPPLRSTERGPARPRGRLPLSPARGNHNSHLRRMQASGNLRHPVSSGGPGEEAPPTAGGLQKASARRDGSVPGVRDSVGGYGTAGWRNRSCSEHRRGGGGGGGGGVLRGAERYEKRRSGSECRREGYERTRVPGLGGNQTKPDAVAVMDSLPLNKTKKSKQVEFVT